MVTEQVQNFQVTPDVGPFQRDLAGGLGCLSDVSESKPHHAQHSFSNRAYVQEIQESD